MNFFCNGILDSDPIGPKNPKYRYKKSSIMKSGHFIIIYLAPIKKLEKIQFWKILDL